MRSQIRRLSVIFKGSSNTFPLWVAVLLPAVGIASLHLGAKSQGEYEFRDLAAEQSGATFAWDINHHGAVVGGGGFPFLYRDGVFSNLGTLGGNDGTAHGINDRGDIVGNDTVAGGNQAHAFLFRDGRLIDLGVLPGGAGGGAFEINETGVIVGRSSSSAAPHSFRWEDSRVSDIGKLGGIGSYATAINNKGWIVGSSNFGPDRSLYHAYLWRSGRFTDLGTLGGANSFAHDINDKGAIVGEAELGPGGRRHAFLWRKGVMQDLGALGERSAAYGINNRRWVVGWSRLPNGSAEQEAAFLWRNGTLINLDAFAPSDWELSVATAINDRGQIVGYGHYKGVIPGGLRAFLLSPSN